jgi:hypothetical protein
MTDQDIQSSNAKRCASVARYLGIAGEITNHFIARAKETKLNQNHTQPRRTRTERILHTLLVFRCPTTLSEQLAEQATQRGVSLSALIRDLLRQGLRAV